MKKQKTVSDVESEARQVRAIMSKVHFTLYRLMLDGSVEELTVRRGGLTVKARYIGGRTIAVQAVEGYRGAGIALREVGGDGKIYHAEDFGEFVEDFLKEIEGNSVLSLPRQAWDFGIWLSGKLN